MRLQLKRCRTCRALGVGPHPQRLYLLDDELYCEQGTPAKPGCYRQALQWHENRETVVNGLKHELTAYKKPPTYKPPEQSWFAYLQELSGMAEFGLLRGDRRIFTYYFSRAMWAWDLSRGAK